MLFIISILIFNLFIFYITGSLFFCSYIKDEQNYIGRACYKIILGILLTWIILILLSLSYFSIYSLYFLILLAWLLLFIKIKGVNNIFNIKEIALIIGVFIIIIILLNYTTLKLALPEIRWDALTYHIPVIKNILVTHHASFIDYIRFPIFPINGEIFMLTTAVFNWQYAKLIPFLTVFFICIVALFDLNLAVKNNSRLSSLFLAFIFSAIFTQVLILLEFSTTAYIDIVLTMICFTAIVFSKQYLVCNKNQYLYISLIAYALAVGTKYSALLFLPLIMISFIVGVKRNGIKKLLPILLLAIGLASIWYIKNYYYTGNPVWPFAYHIFGISKDHIFNSNDYILQFKDLKTYGAKIHNVFDLIKSTKENHLQEGEGISLLYWIPFTLSLILYLYNICVSKKINALRGLWYYILAYFCFLLIWSKSVPNIRYLMPAMPLFILIVTYFIFIIDKINNVLIKNILIIAVLSISIISIVKKIEFKKYDYLYNINNTLQTKVPILTAMNYMDINTSYFVFTSDGAQLNAYFPRPIYGDWFGKYGYYRFEKKCDNIPEYLSSLNVDAAIIESGFINNLCYSRCRDSNGEQFSIGHKKYCIMRSK